MRREKQDEGREKNEIRQQRAKSKRGERREEGREIREKREDIL